MTAIDPALDPKRPPLIRRLAVTGAVAFLAYFGSALLLAKIAPLFDPLIGFHVGHASISDGSEYYVIMAFPQVAGTIYAPILALTEVDPVTGERHGFLTEFLIQPYH